MERRLQDKTIVVVGAGTRGEGMGNGKATAIQFAREGARVLCVDSVESAAQSTVNSVRQEGGAAFPFAADVTSEQDCERAVTECMVRFGRLDVLHNNAGVAFGGDIQTATEDDWKRTFDVNVKGMYLMCKHAIPRMIEGGGGVIINVSSISSIRPNPSVNYTASKGAVNSLTLFLASRYGRYNIRANALLLGFVDTPLVKPLYGEGKLREAVLQRIPLGRFASPWEGAAVAAFLASDEASYITGVLLPVDGGLSAA